MLRVEQLFAELLIKIPDLAKHECSSFIDIRRDVSLEIIYQQSISYYLELFSIDTSKSTKIVKKRKVSNSFKIILEKLFWNFYTIYVEIFRSVNKTYQMCHIQFLTHVLLITSQRSYKTLCVMSMIGSTKSPNHPNHIHFF